MTSSQDFPTAVIARRLKDVRLGQRVTAEELAVRMRAVGVPFDKTVIANLETGRRRYVTVQELFALALVLNVSPLHLVVPIDGDGTEPYGVAPELEQAEFHVRAWIRGERPIGTQDKRRFYAEQPADEFEMPAGLINADTSRELGADGESHPVDIARTAARQAAARRRAREQRDAL